MEVKENDDYFNPRSHERSDPISRLLQPSFLYFNPRSHERSDHKRIHDCSIRQDFNPRSHERSDNFVRVLYHVQLISIHAPTRGATCLPMVLRAMSSYFNPRSHERSDLPVRRMPRPRLRFQSTLPREERREEAAEFDSLQNFNPRSHERSDFLRVEGVRSVCISIHAPTRGATAILHKKFVYFYTIPTINI